MTRRHVLRREVNGAALRDELAARLGRPVEVVTRPPTDDAPDGVLIVEGPDGDVLDLDPAVVADVLAGHVVPPTSEQQALADFDAATTPGGKLAALRNHLARQVDLAETARVRHRQIRGR